ncbi:MAG: RNA polymerase sigma factor [Myxococcota bacterium]
MSTASADTVQTFASAPASTGSAGHDPIDPSIIRELTPRLVRYAVRTVKSEAVAEELVQDTWIAALRSLKAFEGRSSLSSWVFGILRRKIIDHWRRARTQVEWKDENLSASDADPGHQIDHREAVSLLRSELSTLSHLERQAIVLVDVRDLERTEAASELGITRNHLRVLLHRGRDRLKGRLVDAGYQLAA